MKVFVRSCLTLVVYLGLTCPIHSQDDQEIGNRVAIYTALAVAYPESLKLDQSRTLEAKRANIAQINAWAAMPAPSTQPKIEQGDQERVLKALHPNIQQRFLRSHSIQEEIDQQPDQIQVADGTFQNTPQKILQKGSITFTGAQMFPGSDEVLAEVKSWTEAGGQLNADIHQGYCKPSERISFVAHCLLRDRTRDRFARFGSGLVLTFSYSENNRIRGGINIPSGSAAAFANNQFSGSVSYDPSRLLHTGSDWNNAQTAAAKYELLGLDTDGSTSVLTKVKRLAEKKCGVEKLTVTSDCVTRLAGLKGAARAWPFLFPSVTFKEQTQFDFVKYGNGYVPYSGIQPALFTLTLNWDLGKTIASAPARRDALTAITGMVKSNSKPTSAQRKDIQADFVLATLDESKFQDQKWVTNFLSKLASVAANEGLTEAIANNSDMRN